MKIRTKHYHLSSNHQLDVFLILDDETSIEDTVLIIPKKTKY
jgi:hypothetical protein